MFLFKNYADNEARKLVPDPFLFFKNDSYQAKASSLELDFTIFPQPSNQHAIEINCLKLYTIDPEICSILIFQIRVCEQFLQNIFCMIFRQNCSSCCVLLTDQVSLSDCLYFLRYWGICVLQLFVNQVVTSKISINVIFLIKLFLCMIKKSRQNLNILRTKRAFMVKQKTFSIIFKVLSVVKNCFRPQSAPLIY